MRVADLPRDGITRLDGVTIGAISAALDELEQDDPAVVVLAPGAGSAAEIVEATLRTLTDVAIALFPAWLPGGDGVDGASLLDRISARVLAHDHDGPSGVGASLGELALAAGGRPGFGRLPRRDRMTALAYAIPRSYHRSQLALGVQVEPITPDAVDALSGACDWLAGPSTTVWLFGPGAAALDRFTMMHVAGAPEEVPEAEVSVLFPPLSGRPHPASDAEQRLEDSLATQEWAAHRRWNSLVDLGILHPTVRVDLLFDAARLVVEIDGADHRTLEKYADDRRRDADLLLAGYRVLRFTNEAVMSDVSGVTAIIHTLVGRGAMYAGSAGRHEQ